MLNRLRLKLTLLYLFLGILLFIAAGAGAYSVLFFYFQHTTDLALQYKAAQEFLHYDSDMPEELENARRIWEGNSPPKSIPAPGVDREEEEPDSERSESHSHESDERFDANLAPIFVYSLVDGHVITSTPNTAYPVALDHQAVEAALTHGSDWRTVLSGDHTRVRLLTYRVSGPDEPVVIQLGRRLDDQDHLMAQFLLGMILFGGCSLLLLGAAAWLLAGRSLKPAQRAWEQQQTFVANASHELRTPLTLIRAAAEIGLRSHSSDERKTVLQDIISDVDHMSRLVEDLLLLSRLDAGRLKLARTPIDLNSMFGDLQRQMGRVAAEKSVTLELGEHGGTAIGDKDRLRQVLIILLDNAMRHTPEGGTVRLESESKRKFAIITVTDDGPGIPAEHLPHVFERFYQVPTNERDGSRGNGLGLSIAKALVEIMGGKISIDGTYRHGTRVVMSLPVVQAH